MVAPNIKFLVAEVNGTELQEATERLLTSEDMVFSNSEFAAENAKDAIIEANIFGLRKQYAESLSESSTTSTSVWTTKVTLTPGASLPSGNYLLYYNCVHRTDNANRETDIRVRKASTTLFEVRTSLLRLQGSIPVAGFIYLSGISGSDAFTLEFKVGGTATTSYVKGAKLMLWRVS